MSTVTGCRRDRSGRDNGTRRLVLSVMWLLLGVYLAGLLFHGEGFNPFVDGWLGLSAA